MAPPAIRVRLLGGFGVELDGQKVPDSAWRLRKAKAIVKLLALAPRQRMHREQVSDLLWPEHDAQAAANNLHQALFSARRAVGGADGWLQLRDGALLLAEPPASIDADDYERAVAAARSAGTADAYERALALYEGDLLPEDRYEEWSVARREALRELQLATLLEAAALGDDNTAVTLLHQAVVHDPLAEEPRRRLMQLYARTGRRQQALEQYQQLRHALRQAYAAEPSSETRSLYQSVLVGQLEDNVAASTPASVGDGPSPATNVPFQLTRLIGRQRQITEIRAALGRSRLVTLTGTGGAGKTRLAIAVAREELERFADGAWVVELAGLSSGTLAAPAIAAALGLDLRTEDDPVDALVLHLRDRELLLVLDNCEHIIEAAAELAGRLLAACPGLVVLATSREQLRIPGEINWRVPSLRVPDPTAGLGPELLELYPAVQLFCERAATVAPGFALSESNAGAVAEICFRLDGIPLAIELAAARVAVLSPGEIASRLSDVLALLGGGQRGGLTRQQTLGAALEWSHELLTPEERVLFRRLAVFAGTFSLEAAAAVCAGGELEHVQVLPLLERLVDKSLVVADRRESGYRFRMLETIRQYGRAQLDAAHELAGLEQAHRDWYAAFAAERNPHRRGGPPDVPTAEIEVEHDNLRAALGSALAAQPDVALELATDLAPFWMTRGYFVDGHGWIEQALAHAPAPTPTRAAALHAACGLRVRVGVVDQHVALARAAVEIERARGDQRELGFALEQLGVMQWATTEIAAAEQTFDATEALAQKLAQPEVEAAAVHARAVLAYTRGQFEAARDLNRRAFGLLDSVDPALGPLFWLMTPGVVVVADAGSPAPRMYFEETSMHFRRLDSRRAAAYVRCDLAQAQRALGECDPAAAELVAARDDLDALGDTAGVAFALCALGNLARTRGDYAAADEAISTALALRRELRDPRGLRLALSSLGLVAGRSGDMASARDLIGRAREESERSRDAPAAAFTAVNLANLELDNGNADLALPLFEDGEARTSEQRTLRCLGWPRLGLAEASALVGDVDGAAKWRELAREAFELFGDERGVLLADALSTSPAPVSDRS